ncbi:hypothetical protein [Pseudomonas lundensis]|uniref:hypothetical protein n=1 Tax=Pseudomonas lundensis TaxID=86185 RepID=UPI00069BF811|nr:hypothetical protein [Pseudomonas lundensis]
MKESVDIAINALVALYLTKGVQPGELTDNIFEDEYKAFSIKKNTDQTVTLNLSYIEQGEESIQTVDCRYTYDENKTLMLIEQKLGSGRRSIQWSRHDAIILAVDNLAQALSASGYTEQRIAALMLTLPLDLSPRVRAALKAVA